MPYMRGRSSSRSRTKRPRSSSYSKPRSKNPPSYRRALTGYNSQWSGVKSNLYDLSRIFDPFPRKMVAKIRYADNVPLGNTAGVSNVYQFRATSIFDPDFTGAGHQPYGHDTYQNIYNHYMVIKSTFTCTPTTPFNGRLIVQTTDDQTISADSNGNTGAECKDSTVVTQSNATMPATARVYYDRDKWFSTRDQTQSSSADFGANPAENVFFNIQIYGSGPTTSVGTTYFYIYIEFIVEMWELKDLGGS